MACRSPSYHLSIADLSLSNSRCFLDRNPLSMAVIQDLPAELLRRVLELGYAYPEDIPFDLKSMAQVARSWKVPSQEILLFHTKAQQLGQLFKSLERAPISRVPAILALELMPEQARTHLQHLARHDVRLQSLTLATTEADEGPIKASDLNLEVLAGTSRPRRLGAERWLTLLGAGVKRLELTAVVEGALATTSDAKLFLKTLRLNTPYLPSPSFLNPLLSISTNLTRLELAWWTEDFSARMDAPLQKLAPQLRQLSLSGAPAPTRFLPLSFSLDAFLSSCTSLSSLALTEVGPPEETEAILRLIPSRLTVLTTELFLIDAERAEPGDLFGLLDLPALANLKRWRIKCYRGDAHCHAQRGYWEDFCRSRGVEPRDDRHFFTG